MSQKGIGLVFLILGLGVIAVDPVITLTCTRQEAAETTCILDVRTFGFIPVAHETVSGVTGAEVTGNVVNETGQTARQMRTKQVDHLQLNTRSGPFTSTWLTRSESGGLPGTIIVDMPPFGPIVADINGILEYGVAGETVTYRAITWIPILVGAAFAIFGLLAILPVLRTRRD